MLRSAARRVSKHARQRRTDSFAPAGEERPRGSRLLEKAGSVVPQKFLFGLAAQALPGDDIVDRIRELTLRMRVVGGVHQHTVTKELSDVIEHILTFMVL